MSGVWTGEETDGLFSKCVQWYQERLQMGCDERAVFRTLADDKGADFAMRVAGAVTQKEASEQQQCGVGIGVATASSRQTKAGGLVRAVDQRRGVSPCSTETWQQESAMAESGALAASEAECGDSTAAPTTMLLAARTDGDRASAYMSRRPQGSAILAENGPALATTGLGFGVLQPAVSGSATGTSSANDATQVGNDLEGDRATMLRQTPSPSPQQGTA